MTVEEAMKEAADLKLGERMTQGEKDIVSQYHDDYHDGYDDDRDDNEDEECVNRDIGNCM